MNSPSGGPHGLSFADALPLLASAYQSGRLVPFLGAGTSADVCALWAEFVSNLEALRRERPTDTAGGLTARAGQCVAELRNRGDPAAFLGSLRSVLPGRERA
jgi:hypothetical protein